MRIEFKSKGKLNFVNNQDFFLILLPILLGLKKILNKTNKDMGVKVTM